MTQLTSPLPAFTVCIPTYYGGPSLVRAVESIRGSRGVGHFRIIVAVDGNPLAKEIADELQKMDVEIVFSAERGGQVARIKQMVEMVETELTILTQDDIVFDPAALKRMVQGLAGDSSVTMIGVQVAPMSAQTWFESIVAVGVRSAYRMGKQWRGGDNYLLASGRCLAFRSAAIKNFELPDAVINSDAFMYFENRRHGGVYRYIDDSVVYNRSPLTVREHVRQAKKYEYSQEELTHFFGDALSREYHMPLRIKVQAALIEAMQHPVGMLFYVGLRVYTSWQTNEFIGSRSGFWKTDVSTKRVT